MNDRTQSRNVLVAPLLAGLTGLAVGMLFAPRSGRETREKLRSAAHEAKNIAREDMEHAREKMEDGLKHARKVQSQLADALKVTTRTAADQADKVAHEAKHSAREYKSSLNNDYTKED